MRARGVRPFLAYDEAAARIGWLVREGLSRQISGVALKDESGAQTSSRLVMNSGRPEKSGI